MIRFTVPDMTCGGCVRGVTRAIRGVDSEARVEADPVTREVRVEGTRADEAALLDALAEAGFPAEPTPAPAG